MCMLAIPMALLFEIAVLFAWLHDRRKARREAAESFSHLPDDEASPLDLTVEPVDGPTPVDDARR
jgi:sec-independent protein translocase protein TatC